MNFRIGNLINCSEIGPVGVAIKRASHNQLHVGILYRIDSSLRLCHLAWHHRLEDSPFMCNADYYLDDCGIFRDDSINAQVFAARMLTIAKTKQIPYGVAYAGSVFSGDGAFEGFPKFGMGLTCATFVIAVFHSAGYVIVDLDTWIGREEDAEWQERIIDTLERHGASSEHVEAARMQITGVRYRPDEVAAAAADGEPPLSFDRALKLAREIRQLLDA